MNKDKNELLPFCMRCFGVGIVAEDDANNFCHQCGSEGTCTPMKRGDIEYLQGNIRYRIDYANKYTQEDCKKDTIEHINHVSTFIITTVSELLDRAKTHDKSKTENPEIDIFTEYTPKLKTSTYGSKEYKSYLSSMGKALEHHYANNRHHPEHFKNGIWGMNLVDLIEMVCDWKAATLRHDDGDIRKSIEVNKKRFGYSDELKHIFLNTVDLLEGR